MITAKKFLASKYGKRLPEWLRTHDIWRSVPTIDKVFPKLGLENCSGSCTKEIVDFGTLVPTPKKMDIVFSSDGAEGLWDIATMSMRGVMTCRHWDNPHSYSLEDINHQMFMEEITSPNVGVIYLTDGTKTPYGLSMNKRALVRYCPYSKKISVSTIYAKTTNINPNIYDNKERNPGAIRDIFLDFIRTQTKKANIC